MDKQEIENLLREGMKGIPDSIKILVPLIRLMNEICNIAEDKEDFFRLIDRTQTFQVTIEKEGVSFKSTTLQDFYTEGLFWGKQDFVFSVQGNLLYSGFIIIVSQKGINIKDNHEDSGTVLAIELKKQLEEALELIRR